MFKHEGKDVTDITLVRNIVLPKRITGGRGKRGQMIAVSEFEPETVARGLVRYNLAVPGKVEMANLPPAPGDAAAAKVDAANLAARAARAGKTPAPAKAAAAK